MPRSRKPSVPVEPDPAWPELGDGSRLGPARELTRDLLAWFERSRRDLPWRTHDPASGRRDPYRVLVSEVMLQQTQVARVIEKFHAFLDRFPDVVTLAHAPEDAVLAAWTGLGYYRRARLLHAAAKAIVAQHGGTLPESATALRALPGVGAYTAGAIASLAMHQPEALVDTNVSRVLLRIGGVEARVDDAHAQAWVWRQARTLVAHAATLPPTSRAQPAHAAWNEALMELGALVCTARSPACVLCPLREHCAAFQRGAQDDIPLAKTKPTRGAVTHACLLVRTRGARLLVEQRPRTGLWGGLWQVPTLELPASAAIPTPAALAKRLALPAGKAARDGAMDFIFKTTHRDVRFVVRTWNVASPARASQGRRWCETHDALALGMSSPMRRIVRTLARAPSP